MFDKLLEELGGRGASAVLGLIIGAGSTWLLARWRRMYVLDLALDKRAAVIPTKPVPWGRFEPILKAMNLE
jgi:hypothetical protein